MECLVAILLRYAAEGDTDMVGVYADMLDGADLTADQRAALATVGVEVAS